MVHAAALAMLSAAPGMVVLGATPQPWAPTQGVTNGAFTFFVRAEALELDACMMHLSNQSLCIDIRSQLL